MPMYSTVSMTHTKSQWRLLQSVRPVRSVIIIVIAPNLPACNCVGSDRQTQYKPEPSIIITIIIIPVVSEASTIRVVH